MYTPYEYESYDDEEYDGWSQPIQPVWRASYPWVGGLRSIYLLPPLAATLMSLMMMLTLGKLAFSQGFSVERPAASMARSESSLAPLFRPEVMFWEPKILEWAAKWNLDPNLVATVMQIESCGHPQAVSSAGAMGLFQVMPFHFSQSEDPFKPNTNARRGMAYLVRALDSFDRDVYLALAGYNAGITGAGRGESNWPRETKRYTYWGIGIYQDAVAGRDSSERLNEWLQAGGLSLCQRAARQLGINP